MVIKDGANFSLLIAMSLLITLSRIIDSFKITKNPEINKIIVLKKNLKIVTKPLERLEYKINIIKYI